MATIRHLSRAPISEAVLDFRVRPGLDLAGDIIQSIRDAISDDYSKVIQLNMELSAFNLEEQRMSMWRMDTEDGHLVVQFRREGMALSMLPPYTRWEELRDEALRLWRIFEEKARPTSLLRVSTRFINKLLVPTPEDIGEYLVHPPEIPEGLPTSISSFRSQIVLHASPDLSTSITLALISVENDECRILIDTDTQRSLSDMEIPADEAKLQDVFEELRDLKNQAFFNSIQEKTAEGYQ